MTYPLQPPPTQVVFLALATWLGLGLHPGETHGQAPEAQIELQPPDGLRRGDRADLLVLVHVPPRTAEPLLLTPTSEGAAVEVVRGRLLREDAEDPEADPLRFRVPLVAAEAGTAVVRVRVESFTCEERCRSVTFEEDITLRVEPRIEG